LEKAEEFFTIRKESREIIFGGLRLRRRERAGAKPVEDSYQE
jgi:hypothetical protein